MAVGGNAGRSGSALKWRDQAIIALLEKLARHRELDETEMSLMERTVRRLSPKRSIWRWSEKDDRLLQMFIKRRAKTGRPKPFQRDDQVRLLAEQLGRNYEAVHKRIQRLRKQANVHALEKKRKAKVRKW